VFISCTTPDGASDGASNPAVSVGLQSGTIVSGTAGSASFAATTSNVSAGTAGTVSWYTSSDGSTGASTPSWATVSVTSVSDNAAIVTISATSSAVAGTYYFKLSEGSVSSSIVALTINAAPSVSLLANSGSLTAGTAGTLLYTVKVQSIADNTQGSLAWYTGSGGGTTTNAPTGLGSSVTPTVSSAAILTLSSSTTTPAGTYYF
jgi:hypothetical protein